MPQRNLVLAGRLDLRTFINRLMEQLAVGSEKILGVRIAESNLGIEISCWRRGVIGIMEFRASVFPHGVTEIPELTEG
jgi:uncharacterized membrane protein SpoIIM required for sporulation